MPPIIEATDEDFASLGEPVNATGNVTMRMPEQGIMEATDEDFASLAPAPTPTPMPAPTPSPVIQELPKAQERGIRTALANTWDKTNVFEGVEALGDVAVGVTNKAWDLGKAIIEGDNDTLADIGKSQQEILEKLGKAVQTYDAWKEVSKQTAKMAGMAIGGKAGAVGGATLGGYTGNALITAGTTAIGTAGGAALGYIAPDLLIKGGEEVAEYMGGAESKSVLPDASDVLSDAIEDVATNVIAKPVSLIAGWVGSKGDAASKLAKQLGDPKSLLLSSLDDPNALKQFAEKTSKLEKAVTDPMVKRAVMAVDLQNPNFRTQLHRSVTASRKLVGRAIGKLYKERKPIFLTDINTLWDDAIAKQGKESATSSILKTKEDYLSKTILKGLPEEAISKYQQSIIAKRQLLNLSQQKMVKEKALIEARKSSKGTILKGKGGLIKELEGNLKKIDNDIKKLPPIYSDAEIFPPEFLRDGRAAIPPENIERFRQGVADDAYKVVANKATGVVDIVESPELYDLERNIKEVLNKELSAETLEKLKPLNESYSHLTEVRKGLNPIKDSVINEGGGAKVGLRALGGKIMSVFSTGDLIAKSSDDQMRYLSRYQNIVSGGMPPTTLHDVASALRAIKPIAFATDTTGTVRQMTVNALNNIEEVKDKITAAYQAGELDYESANSQLSALGDGERDLQIYNSGFTAMVNAPEEEKDLILYDTLKQLKATDSPLYYKHAVKNNEFSNGLITDQGRLLSPAEQKVYVNRISSSDKLNTKQKAKLVNSFNQTKMVVPLEQETINIIDTTPFNPSANALYEQMKARDSKSIAKHSQGESMIERNKNLNP